MSSSHRLLKSFRLIHLYIGVFTAPALIFFAFSGALQTFSLHETTRGSSYKPPAWAVVLAQIHKKQTPIVPVRKNPQPDSAGEKLAGEKTAPEKSSLESGSQDKAQGSPHPERSGAQADSPRLLPDAIVPRPHNALPLKIFFLVVAISLFLSALTGLYMSYKYIRNRKLITATIIAGVVVPILLAIF
jgi:hypothetical protein